MQSCRSPVVRFWLAAAAHTDPTKATIVTGGDAAMAPLVHPFFQILNVSLHHKSIAPKIFFFGLLNPLVVVSSFEIEDQNGIIGMDM
jgi:hypothetical protein